MRGGFSAGLSLVFLLGCSGGDASSGDAGDDGSPASDATIDSPKDAPIDVGPPMCNGVVCGANEICFQSTSCACAAGFVPSGNGCVAAAAGSPAQHTHTDVCTHWSNGHLVTTNNPYTQGAQQCAVGTFAQGGITDTLVRINMFRWMVGAGDTVTDNATKDQGDQACAIIAVWNPAGPNAHTPPPSSTCYTSLGATWAGQSNIAWGVTSPDAIDEYIQDNGNESTLGHRRWVLHPPLGVIGVGYVEASGTQYGSAQCLGVFDSSGTGPQPVWFAWPPPGYSPVAVSQWEWSFHYPAGMTNATVTVKDLGTGKPLAMTSQMLPQGYGDDTFAFTPSGWTPKAGDIYRVTVTPVSKAPIVYDVMPATCP